MSMVSAYWALPCTFEVGQREKTPNSHSREEILLMSKVQGCLSQSGEAVMPNAEETGCGRRLDHTASSMTPVIPLPPRVIALVGFGRRKWCHRPRVRGIPGS